MSQNKKENKLCTKCRAPLPAGTKFKMCSACREYNRDYKKTWTPPSGRKRAPESRPALSISQVCRMAQERHISCGEMVLIIEKGETQ